MRFRILGLALPLVVLAVSAGCGSSSGTSSTALTDPDKEIVTNVARAMVAVKQLSAPVAHLRGGDV
jgi:hypothetical protein